MHFHVNLSRKFFKQQFIRIKDVNVDIQYIISFVKVKKNDKKDVST